MSGIGNGCARLKIRSMTWSESDGAFGFLRMAEIRYMTCSGLPQPVLTMFQPVSGQ